MKHKKISMNFILILIGILFIAITFWILRYLGVREVWKTTRKQKVTTMIILGSGGHTGEMMNLLETLDLNVFNRRVYVFAKTDVGLNSSENKAKAFEQKQTNQQPPNYVLVGIRRSREVGQSYFSSIFTTLAAFVDAFRVVWTEKPDLIITNGPGTCIPICFSAFLIRFITHRYIGIVFSESFACVDHLSVSGLLLYFSRQLDGFFIQWASAGLPQKYPNAIYAGRIPNKNDLTTMMSEEKPSTTQTSNNQNKNGYVVVTVGSTNFETLIEAMDSEEIVKALSKAGYSGLHFQYGRGKYKPSVAKSTDSFEVVSFDFKPNIVSAEFEKASLIISHAGAASTLESLSMGKNLLLVPNEGLMNNHQVQIASELEKQQYLKYARGTNPKELRFQLLNVLNEPSGFSNIKRFPEKETPRIALYLQKNLHMG